MPPTLSWGLRKIDVFVVFRVFSYAKKRMSFGMRFFDFSVILMISGRSNVDFHGFWIPKQIPGGSFFEAFFGPRLWTVFFAFFLG